MHAPIRVGVAAFVLVFIIITLLDFFVFENVPIIWQGAITEAHGLLFDILLFGILILWIDEKRTLRSNTRDYLNALDRLRTWRQPEASHKHSEHIIKLLGMGVKPTKLQHMFLVRAQLNNLGLINVKFRKSEMSGANLQDTKLNGSDLSGAVLSCAHLGRADLRGANLEGADLSWTILDDAKLDASVADLSSTVFQNALVSKMSADPDVIKWATTEKKAVMYIRGTSEFESWEKERRVRLEQLSQNP